MRSPTHGTSAVLTHAVGPADSAEAGVRRVLAEMLAGDELTAPQIARELKVNGATVARWFTRGLPDGFGGRLPLVGVRVGRKFKTSRAELERWLVARSRATSADPVPAARTPADRKRAAERAGAALDAMGVR